MENNSELRLLTVSGLTYNPMNPGIYGLILKEVTGDRHLPIIVGENEAHSIECKLQEIITARPLTHDLMVNLLRAFGLALTKVIIKRLEGGVYAADLYINSGERSLIIDSRSSDAIALALRTGAPIFTTDELLNDAGVRRTNSNISIKRERTGMSKTPPSENKKASQSKDPSGSLSSLPLERLQEMLDLAVEKEQYEWAAEIKKEIEKRGV